MRSESITVTSRTSLGDLQRFASKLDDGMRLRATKVGSDSYELYAKDSKPGLWSRITGRSAETRTNAREALNVVFNNAERSYGGPVLDNVRSAMNEGIRSKDVKGDALRVLVDSIDMQSIDSDNFRLENKGPGLAKLPAELRDELLMHAEAFAGLVGLKDSEVIEASKVLARLMKESFEAAGLDSSVKMRLGLSSGSRLAYEIRQAITERAGVADNDLLRGMLEHAFAIVLPDLIENEEGDGGEIMLGGDKFVKGKKLGSGAFGSVDLYTCLNDPSKQVALKTVIAPSDDASMAAEFTSQVDLLKREGNVHLAVLGEGNENIVGFEGAVRMRDGVIGIAVEYAPHGTAHSAFANIKEAVSDGRISADEAKTMQLSLLKDMANGLAHIHRGGKNFVHFDFKTFNVLVGEGGVGKIADFGLTAKGDRVDFPVTTIAQNPLQLGPELSRYNDDRLEIQNLPRNAQEWSKDKDNPLRVRASKDNTALKRFGGLTKDEKEALIQNVIRAAHLNQQRAIDTIDTTGIDSWGLGYVAFTALLGRELAENQLTSRLAARMRSFAGDVRAIDVSDLDSSRQDWAQRNSGAFAGSTGTPAIDNLLNGLLHPDPAYRMTVSDAAQHQAFSLPGVGSTETRAKLVAVMEKDWNKLSSLQTDANSGSDSSSIFLDNGGPESATETQRSSSRLVRDDSRKEARMAVLDSAIAGAIRNFEYVGADSEVYRAPFDAFKGLRRSFSAQTRMCKDLIEKIYPDFIKGTAALYVEDGFSKADAEGAARRMWLNLEGAPWSLGLEEKDLSAEDKKLLGDFKRRCESAAIDAVRDLRV